MDTCRLRIKVPIEAQKIKQQFAKVYSRRYLFRNIEGLQVGYYHKKERIGADASKVGVILVVGFEELLQHQNHRLNNFIFFQKLLDE